MGPTNSRRFCEARAGGEEGNPAEELELIRSGSDTVADRLHVFYRLRVKKPGDLKKIVEQHLLCTFDHDRITALDLVCSGFRPDEAGTAPEDDQLKRN